MHEISIKTHAVSYISFWRLSCNFLLSFCFYIFTYLIEFIQIRLDKWPLRLQLILTRFLMGNACDHQRKRNWINITKFPIPFHAQEKLLVLIIVVEMTSNFRQEIRYSYYRNDPVKYDLNNIIDQETTPLISDHTTGLTSK